MGDQPDRRRKPFRSWFSSWSSPSRPSQRPRRQPQPPSNTSQSPDLQERGSWPETSEDQHPPLQPPPPPPPTESSPPPKATQAEPPRAIDDSQELAIGSKLSPPQEEKPTQTYKTIDLESLQNLKSKISHAESQEGEAIVTRENLQVENVSTEINEGKTNSVSESKQDETTNAIEPPIFEAKFLRNEASVEHSIDEETEKDRSPEKTEEPETVERHEGNPNNQRKKTDPKLSITVLTSKPLNDSLKEPKRHISTDKERKITICTVPRATAASRDQDRQGMQMELKEDLSKLVQKLSVGHKNKPGNEQGVSIITLASKNKGASMFISRLGLRGEVPINIHNGKIIGKGTTSEDQNEQNRNTSIATSINSNVQGINSSILNETNYSERNPGVHMTISAKPTATWSNRAKEESIKTQKASSMMATPQKLIYEPRIRRRCLRGLLVEPSEDDMENSEKQRLHGCRFTCDDKKKTKGEGTGS
ncbi:hypothetical protein KSP40_PGU001755 [Platanthera guangdongensis]|uniref:Uncharacterized protein n=1 Tax=Platanthera guangdongensis TaxID=2320717 RepID=A0ABR2LE11_9ASPA